MLTPSALGWEESLSLGVAALNLGVASVTVLEKERALEESHKCYS